jgi:hypothetical protein
MSVEARKMVSEDSRGTIEDKTLVGALVRKWEPMLEGIANRTVQDKYTVGVTAMLMENQSQYLQNLNEETKTVNVGSFTKFIFPVLRRVFPNLIANEIVSVQPMTAPVGAVFFLDYVYGTQKGGTNVGNVFPRDFDKDYSSEFINGEQLQTGNVAGDFGGAGAAMASTTGFNPVRPLDTSRGFSVTVKEINKTTGAVVQTTTDTGSGTFTVGATGTINYSTGAIGNFLFTVAPANGNPIKAYYFYDGEMSTKVPQIQLDVKKAAVEATPRRLKALWSSEAAEDLRAFHGLDAETEIVSAVAQEIALEIDREIIQNLFAASTGTTATFDRVPPAGIAEMDHLRSMITQISTVSNLIHKKTLRAPANFIVTSPEVSALFSQLTTHGDFRSAYQSGGEVYGGNMDMPRQMAGSPQGQFGIYKVGTLMNKWQVYEDPFFSRDQMLIGLKGSSYLDAGYVWAPYIPLQVTPTFLDPSDFSFRKGLRTRYATKLLRSEYYGQVRVTNL